MTRSSRLGSAGLLTRHLGSGIAASLLVALLIAAAVLAVALAPRALARLGTAELRHQLGQESPALLDLTGSGTLGFSGQSGDLTIDDLFGAGDRAIDRISTDLEEPLQGHVGPTQWVVSTKTGDGILPNDVPYDLKLALSADLEWTDRIEFIDGVAPTRWEGSDVVDPATAGQQPPPPPPIPVAISTAAADELEVTTGDVIEFSPAPLLITGVYDLVDPGDAYWVHETALADAILEREPGKRTTARFSVYVDPLTVGGLQSMFAIGPLSAFIEVDPSGLDYADAQALQTQVRQLSARQVGLPLFGSLSFRSGLPDAVERVVGRVTSASSLLALSVSGLLGVLFAVFALGVQSVIARRRPALALAAARGASGLQLRAATVFEGLLISVPGSAAALGLAVLLLPGDAGTAGWVLPGVVALAPPVLFGVLTSPRQLRSPRGDLQVRSRSRVRWIAEVAVAGLAALSLFLLARRGLVESSAVVGIDPLLAATPLLLAAAVCIGVLRLYPALLLGVQRLLRRRPGSTGVLGAARAIRDPALGFAAALALVVGISIVVFSTVMATTLRAGLVQGAIDSVGSDLRVTAQDLPPGLVDDISGLEGVTGAVAIATVTQVELTVDTNRTEVFVVLTDTAGLNALRPDIPVLADRVDGRVPVVISSDWADRVTGGALTVGGTPLHNSGPIRADAIPGATRHYIIVDSAYAGDLGVSASDPELVLAGLDPDARAADVAAQVDDLVTAAQPEQFRGLVVVTSAAALLAETQASPTVAGLESALLLAAFASLLLTMLTVVLASVAAAASRNRLVGVLRILGMSPRQLRAIQAWELGPVAITAVVVGTALGLVLPLIVTGVLDLRAFVGGTSQPGPVVDPLWVLAAVGAFTIVVVLAGVIAAALGRRFAPAGTLKMGEG